MDGASDDIVIRDQVRLGPLRCLQLSLIGMSHRMFRSMVTVSILALAVAFLVHMLSYGVVAQETKVRAYREMQDGRLLGEWLMRLKAADADAVIMSHLAEGRRSHRFAEYVIWSSMPDDELVRGSQTSVRLKSVADYFDGLPIATRAVLTSGLDAENVLTISRELGASPQLLELFEKRLKEFGVRAPLGNFEHFRALVSESLPQLQQVIDRIKSGHNRAISFVAAASGSSDPRKLFADSPPRLLSWLSTAGFQVSGDTVPNLRSLAQEALDFDSLNLAIGEPEVRTALAKMMNIKAGEIDLPGVLKWLGNTDSAGELAAVLQSANGLTGERLYHLAERNREHVKLQSVVGNEAPEESGGLLSLPSNLRWLIAVSFLVCAVGVANAMLMSVTERFSEIATMKCLGAMNGFVIQVFFFEAVLQGLLGGVAGLAAGVFLALLRVFFEYGLFAFRSLPWGDLGSGMAVSLLTGVVLAAAAAIGPVWVAARLSPMEAMRVE